MSGLRSISSGWCCSRSPYPIQSPIDARIRDKAQLLRTPDRRDLYPLDGLRLRLADGTLLSPVRALDIAAAGTVNLPDVVVTGTITPGYGMRVSVWAVALTRDGIPSRFTGPATARTCPAPLIVPPLTVVTSARTDTASWPLVTAPAEISIERSVDAGATWARVFALAAGDGDELCGAGLRGAPLPSRAAWHEGQPTATGNAVAPA